MELSESRILVADDEALIRGSLREILEYEGYRVEEAADGKEAWEQLRKTSFDAVFCDIKMPGIDGIELLEKIREFRDIPFIMISGHGDIQTAVDCIKKGAFDFIAKPLEINRILVSLKNALDKRHLEKHARHLEKQVDERYRIVGSAGPFAEALEVADKVAATEARVLVVGENGTGKELIARRIHRNSRVGEGPFVEVNCAAIPSELIESELFGHEKGAFTSAVRQRKGSFEQAENGTLFLDEIGDMGLSAQAKVLRALQEHRIMRVGGEKPIVTNARVIAATNKDLRQEISAGRFREDLFHRLDVIEIRVPPLREHAEDIPLLVDYFIRQISSEMTCPPKRILPEAVEFLKRQHWPGNVRQLRNMVERLLILCPGDVGLPEVEKYL